MKISARTRARRLAIQSLYEWQISKNSTRDIITEALQHQAGKNIDVGYYKDLVNGTAANVDEIDRQLTQFVSRPLIEIDVVELAVLRLATFELLQKPEAPYRVIINEAIECAKMFGAEQSHKFVNGILDNLAKSVRPVEWQAKK